MRHGPIGTEGSASQLQCAILAVQPCPCTLSRRGVLSVWQSCRVLEARSCGSMGLSREGKTPAKTGPPKRSKTLFFNFGVFLDLETRVRSRKSRTMKLDAFQQQCTEWTCVSKDKKWRSLSSLKKRAPSQCHMAFYFARGPASKTLLSFKTESV